MEPSLEVTAAIACWAVALSTFVFGITNSLHAHHNAVALAMSVFFAVVACVPTMMAGLKYAIRQNRVTVEQIAQIVDALHQGNGDVSRLH